MLWPERYPYSVLYMMRNRQSLCVCAYVPVRSFDQADQKFLEPDIEKAVRKGQDLVLQDEPREDYETEYTASGLDLAISQKAGSDDTALLSLDKVKLGNGEIKPGDYVIRNIERGKFLPKEVIDLVSKHYYKLKPLGIRVESVAFQQSMALDLGDRDIPVRSYNTGVEKNDPDIGVNSLAIILSQGKLVLPYSNKDARTRQLVTQLINEMRAYPEGHSGDSLMALWFAYSEMRDCRTHHVTFLRVDGVDFHNPDDETNNSQAGNQTKPDGPKIDPTSETNLPWKNAEVLKKLERQADIDCIKKGEYERRNWQI